MGLDIGFDRKAAEEAGLEFVWETNGDDEAIQNAIDEGGEKDYIEWLYREEEFVVVPNRGTLVVNNGMGDDVVIRANKWGYVYEPMTQWLKANNIEWSEF